MKDHRLIDERSLAFDRLIADKLCADPGLVAVARANLSRWLQTVSRGGRPALLEWQEILEGSEADLFATLEGVDERAVRLRQSSPFCGMFTAQERTEILLRFQSRESIPA